MRVFRRRVLVFALTAVFGFAGLSTAEPASTTAAGPEPSTVILTSLKSPELSPGLYADFVTSRGTIVAELFFEKAPLTVTSFVGLAEGTLGPIPGKPFFDGLTFHRVVPDFVVQGGDPRGDGEGGPGYEFADELRRDLRHDAVGILSMANAGPDTNGSQFFFTLRPVTRLDFMHSVFGRVVRGLEVLSLIQRGDTMQVKIRRIGRAAESFVTDQAHFDALSATAPRYQAPFFDDPHQLLPVDPPRARSFQAKLANLARFSKLTLYIRVFEKRDATDLEAKPDAVAKRFAELFGVRDTGVVALYFADRDEWALWIAEPLMAQFNSQGGSIHDAKQAFLNAARTRHQLAVGTAQIANSGQPLIPQQKLKLFIDEIMQGFIDQLLPLEPTQAVLTPQK